MQIRRLARRVALSIVLLSLFLSCATAPDSRDGALIGEFLLQIEAADAGGAASLSRLPFLVDSEVIFRDGDLVTLWESVKESDFSLAEVRIESILPSYDQAVFDGGFLPQAFARRIAEEAVSIVRVETRSGELTLLIEGTGYRSFALRGIRRSM